MTPLQSGAFSRSGRVLGVGLSALVALGFGFASLPAGADQGAPTNPTQSNCTAVQLVVGNPAPGDLLQPGTYVIQGSATDASAAQAPGIKRVQVFFDNSRENGGSFIGEVQAGQDSLGQHLTASGFALLAHFPDTSAPNNTHTVFFYAQSASTGQEEVVSFQVQMKQPLVIDTPLTPTPTPAPAILSPAPCGTPTPTPTFPPFPVALAGATPGVTDNLTLRAFNPQAGDAISHGMYVIQGLAFDASAQSGTGIERVEVFLDPRDQGGQFLGAASLGLPGAGGAFGFQLVATFPNRTGGHMLSIYAHSATSGRETSVSIPISIT